MAKKKNTDDKNTANENHDNIDHDKPDTPIKEEKEKNPILKKYPSNQK